MTLLCVEILNRRLRTESERKTVFKLLRNRTKATNGETWNPSVYIFQLVGLVSGQHTPERIVLAARLVRLRKEGWNTVAKVTEVYPVVW